MKSEPNIDKYSVPGALVQTLQNGDVRCTACAHRCLIHTGKRGICGVRFNQDGVLRVPGDYAAGVQIDPIEKKPFSHFLPGSDVLTFGMLGCNFHCSFCQNWYSSQALRDPCAHESTETIRPISAEKLVKLAVSNNAASIASSYNEPMITSEWGVEVFKQAKAKGLHTAFVSNGYGTPEVLDYIRPWLDGLKIDLKSMRDSQYRKMGGTLQPVLDTIKQANDLGLWVEVVTLVIPGFNDSVEELWDTSRFITSVSQDIPWHVTAYHPDYKMVDAPPTSSETLQKAAEIGQEAGLRYVYAGNIPGRVGSLENTYCPHCSQQLITRTGFRVNDVKITVDGNCPSCGEKIAGIWA
jgi:pyruvate formate lyase activating enzyme